MGQYYYMPDPGEPISPSSRWREPQPAPCAADLSGIVWVQGEAGARGYPVARGATVPLWDSENQVIYLKSVDRSGLPSMRVLDYTERVPMPAGQRGGQIDPNNIVTWDKLWGKMDEYLADRLKRPSKGQKTKEDEG